ncbi:hypothetical protein MMC10_008505 [Thelotrema lepadinum]|nr:hypothetical protein [Thelotrema lepadinum]
MAMSSIEQAPSPSNAAVSHKSRRSRKLQRVEIAARSFRVLKNLTPEQVDRFMDSYIIYDLDWADEKTMIETLGPDYQNRVGQCLSDYYCILNHMCAIGDLEKMYIPPLMDPSENLSTNQLLYEATIAQELDLPKHARVLELGCGRGRVAAHISSLTGATITGLNIDADQVANALTFTKDRRLSNTFVVADFNVLPLPFPDASFDAFYQIQAFSLAKDIPALCRELHRVLKPGAKLSLLDWASLPAYNPENLHHRELMRRIKPLIGAVGTPTPTSLAADLSAAGFTVLRSNNASKGGLQAPLIEKADGYFRAARNVLRGLVGLRVLPGHFKRLFERFTRDCDAFVEADRGGLSTTSWHWLAEKPVGGVGEKGRGEGGKEGGGVSEASSDTAVEIEARSSEGEDKEEGGTGGGRESG